MRCLTVTLNPAIDVTYDLAQFTLGGVNRVVQRRALPGGKGNNVARILAARDHDVIATGFLAGNAGAFIETGLRERGVQPGFVWLESGESRTCHTMTDLASGVSTEMLETGPFVADKAAEDLFALVSDLAMGRDLVVISGSVPPGYSESQLERLVELARAKGCQVAVDSSGSALAALLRGRPNLVKPNEDELFALIGYPISRSEMIAFVQEQMLPTMANDARALVSLGANGALLISQSEVMHAVAPGEIAIANTVGCGDALLAGFMDAITTGADEAEALAQAVAFGTAAALQDVAGYVEAEDVVCIRRQIVVTPWQS